MGHRDLHRIHPIYRACVDFCKLAEIPFEFKEDTGSFETAIEFSKYTDGDFHPPISTQWTTNPLIICPDILDYDHRIIIEFEEETGNRRSGAKMAKKGHGHEGDLSTPRDVKRNYYYKKSGFYFLRIWESNKDWKLTLFEFLIKCWREM